MPFVLYERFNVMLGFNFKCKSTFVYCFYSVASVREIWCWQ